MENMILESYDDVIYSAYGVVSGVNYIMQWLLNRYYEGIRAGKISTETVNSIQDIKTGNNDILKIILLAKFIVGSEEEAINIREKYNIPSYEPILIGNSGDKYLMKININGKTFSPYNQKGGTYSDDLYEAVSVAHAGERTIGINGCAAAAVSTIISGFGLDTKPGAVARKFTDYGDSPSPSSQGNMRRYFEDVCRLQTARHNQDGKDSYERKEKELTSSLESGHVAVAFIGKNDDNSNEKSWRNFATQYGSHYITVLDYNPKTEQYIVVDPNEEGVNCKFVDKDILLDAMGTQFVDIDWCGWTEVWK